VEETKAFRGHITSLNENIVGVSQMYNGVIASKDKLDAMNNAIAQLGSSEADAKGYTEQMASLNKNLRSLNGVYGNVLNAMTGGKG
jgi:hypothetical protein